MPSQAGRASGSPDTIARTASRAWDAGAAGRLASPAVNLKNPLVVLGVVFGLFFLISQPLALAGLMLAVLEILRGFGEAAVQFTTALF